VSSRGPPASGSTRTNPLRHGYHVVIQHFLSDKPADARKAVQKKNVSRSSDSQRLPPEAIPQAKKLHEPGGHTICVVSCSLGDHLVHFSSQSFWKRAAITTTARSVHMLTVNVLTVRGGYLADSVDDDPSGTDP